MRTRCFPILAPSGLHRLAPLVLVAALAFAPAAAFAFAVQTVQPGSQTLVKWPKSKIPFFLHPAGSADLPPKTALDELRAGFVGWQQSCTALTFVEGYHCNTALNQCLYDKSGSNPKTCNSDADCPASTNLKLIVNGFNPNGRNELVWIENSSWKFGTYVLGVTSPARYNNGSIYESDIVFNGYHHAWTDKAGESGNKKQHILSVGIHEIGHFFGVQHMLGGWNPNDPPTMAPNVAPYGLSASLNADDAKAPCFLHPKTTYTCKNDTDCPYMNHDDDATGEEYYSAKMVCQSGTCVFGGTVVGKTELGGECAIQQDCKTGLFCQAYGNASFCSQACTTTKQDCPQGFSCYGYQGGGGKGACLSDKGVGKPTKKPGEACESSAECTTLFCVQEVCRVKCTVKAPVECDAASEDCAKLPASALGACVPKTQPKKAPFGGACFNHDECESNVCMKTDADAESGNCRTACTGKGTCQGDFGCVDQGDGVLGCLPGSDKEGLGKACAAPGDCVSTLCIGDAAAQYCSAACDPAKAGACPCGMACEQTSAGPLCLTGAKKACVGAGAACSASSECQSGVCLGGACRAACSVVTPAGCGTDQGCRRLQGYDTQGGCTARGSLADGAACSTDGDCASLFCDADVTANQERRCQRPCPVGNAEICGPALACFAVVKGFGLCHLAGSTPATGTFEPPPASTCTAARTATGTWGWLALPFVLLALVRVRRRDDAGVDHA